MEYNIPLMRRVYEHITRHDFDQSHWTSCVAGWTVRLSRSDWTLLTTTNPLTNGFQALNLCTGAIAFTEDIAGHLLGMEPVQIAGIASATNPMAINWLEDILVEHDMREFERIAAGFDTEDYPIGEVQG
jgi:hypothetical protein